jgi:hypothetical protein
MPILTLADYQGWDDAFALFGSQEHTIKVDLPDDYTRDRTVILGYMITPTPVSVRYDIDFNDIVVHDEAVVSSGSNTLVRWKVIDGDKLKIGPNTIQFRVVGGLPIVFSDVVLWFQRTVTIP